MDAFEALVACCGVGHWLHALTFHAGDDQWEAEAEGLDGEQVALLQLAHHALVDTVERLAQVGECKLATGGIADREALACRQFDRIDALLQLGKARDATARVVGLEMLPAGIAYVLGDDVERIVIGLVVIAVESEQSA